eukprot:scaffold2501_cov174-Amphora_coffeaeformis.AAC.26
MEATSFHTTTASIARQQHSQAPNALPGREMLQPGPRVIFAGNNTSQLTEHDAVAVRNLEAFAVDHPEAVDSFGNRLGLGLVGIRCIHCAGVEAGLSSVIFPRSLQEMGDCIREMAELHLGKCHRTPQRVRQLLEGALQRRHEAKNEGGSVWYQEQQDREKLLNFCATRCQELRLVDNYPPSTGIMFSYYGARIMHPSESLFEEAKQPARPASSLDEPFDPSDIPFDDLNPEPFMVQVDNPTLDPGYDNMPSNFPFFREPSGDWICKFCQHLHPQYRDGQSRWSSSDRSAPPAHFIDFHLNHCRMYQQSLLQDYRGPPNPVVLPNPIRAPEARPAIPTAASAATARQPAEAATGTRTLAGVSGGGSQKRVSVFLVLMYFARINKNSVQLPRQPAIVSASGSSGTAQQRAIAFLEANDMSGLDTDGTMLPVESQLVIDEDRLLLTDYFYYLFKQLRLCRFTETDRKTRGGKRQTIKIGYGGLQCVHCAGQPNPRKFFWANVDRIANSFAEMPSHILKCRHCPVATRDALLTLKETHAEQMTSLPRGSQKVFLRRMWRRLHKNDPKDDATSEPARSTSAASRRKAPPPPSIDTSLAEGSARPRKVAKTKEPGGSPGTSISDGTVVVVERSTDEAAKALVYGAAQTGPPSPSSRVLLSTPEDKQWLSDYDCFVRRQIEVFCASREDIELATKERKFNVKEGQVGIRCIHCALSKKGVHEGGGIFYPQSINAIYDAVRDFLRLHLDTCTNLPQDVGSRLKGDTQGASSLSSVLRNYFQMSAKCIGLVDTKDGIRATGESMPLQSQEFTFIERKSPAREGKGGRKREPDERAEI